MDSADVWVHPESSNWTPTSAPSASRRAARLLLPTGQRWGNPLYRWDVLAKHGFDWWIDRIRRACELYDIVRLDHFRGFEAYWAIPAPSGRPFTAPGSRRRALELFRALEAALVRSRWWPRTWASSPPKWTRCGRSWACPA